jgi:Peptidase S46
MKKLFVSILLIVTISFSLCAEEGMWIPVLLQQLNIKQMQDMGLKLSAEDIYSINHSSLKDAIVQFGGGCTAEIVSPNGLILTNHHCGLGSIQRLSSPQNDYLADGFWANSYGEELPCPGLTVTLLNRMEDVTAKVLQNVTDEIPEYQRMQIIKQNITAIEKEATTGNSYEAKVRSFYYGNQYYLFVSEVFKDIRLVGAPPSGIGQFGGDTDNWMWPRHGGDFSVFRIYVNSKNEPAEYSKDNLPYQPKKFLPISLKGYQKGDFTFVFGYPGTTREYLTSYGVDLIANQENPIRISLRQERLDIINKAITENKRVRIQYTSKHQGIANGWKKMIGETNGIKRINAINKKKVFEYDFQKWADSSLHAQNPTSSTMHQPYFHLLYNFSRTYANFTPVDMASVYLTEAGMGIEIIRFADGFADLVKKSKDKKTKPEDISKSLQKLKSTTRGFYKDYNSAIDRQIFEVMTKEMMEKMDAKFLPIVFQKIEKKYHRNYTLITKNYFDRSMLPDSAKLYRFLNSYKSSEYKKLEKDPIFRLSASIYEKYTKDVIPQMQKFNLKIDSLQRFYMAGQMEMGKRRFYPDANSTLRIAYGNVDGFQPADAVSYNYFTTSKGILEKENPTIYDYAVHPKLKKLFTDRDFGPYSDKDGSLHIAFTATNHTTGGNSGSPVLDANGNLLGLNFDRNWEGTMSDLMYDPALCRNITLDIRYCLFIIDKFAGAQRLINEMKIIN